MNLNRTAREKLVRALAASVIEHADELTSLDQAIGDGDHGLNMKRGFEAVLATLPALADKSMPEMLKTIGMTLVMKVGGASGPLVGTFFMELGKALPEQRKRPRLPSVPRQCSRPAAGRPFSANVRSVTWTRVRARRHS
jgi:dihydroxyacetone kinase-like protein